MRVDIKTQAGAHLHISGLKLSFHQRRDAPCEPLSCILSRNALVDRRRARIAKFRFAARKNLSGKNHLSECITRQSAESRIEGCEPRARQDITAATSRIKRA